MATFTGYLRARSDDELVALLVRRPDLATPHPATLASLAARATSRASLDRALTWVDALVLQVVEAVVVLDGPRAPTRADLHVAVGATGADAPVVDRAVDDAVALALVWPDDEGALHAAPGVGDALGSSVAGLAPAADGTTDAPLADVADAPAGAGPVLDALTWGPPVGLVPPPGAPGGEAVRWLVEHGLLERGDGRHVVLPRHVALTLRGGRTHRAPALAPTFADAPVRDTATVAAESARAAEQTVRLVRQLLARWEQTPPGVLRAGGLGARDLRRTAQGLDVDDAHAAWLVETAASAGLVADDGEETPTFVTTLEADVWAAQDLAPRWAVLARAWLTSARTPWLVGGRDERGALRSALDPELTRPWVPRLRRAVLDVLASAPVGAAPTPQDVHAALQWRSPRSVPPLTAVEAILADAARLGVLGAGALAAAGRALLTGDDAAEALAADLPAPVDEILLQGDLTGIVPGRPGAELEDLLDLAAVVESRGGAVTVRFTADSVLRALDQGTTADDLLARLAAAARGRVPQPLEYLVRDVARKHGRLRAGAASSYVRADDPALLAGLADDPRLAVLRPRLLAPTVLVADASPAELLAALRARGLAPVAEDARGAVVHAVAPERRARARGSRVAPVRERPLPERAAAVVATLRRGDAEPDAHAGRTGGVRSGSVRSGAVPSGGGPARTGRRGAPTDEGAEALDPVDPADPGQDADSLRARATGVAQRTAASRARRGATPPSSARATSDGTSEPGALLVLLREAAQARTSVWLEVVGPDGRSQRRLVRPLKVEGGRLRALDEQREAELTVAVHRIAGVDPADT
ncbi:conserved hypothetical protein [Cellulomonas flavigena DSM 20109]|uniref:Helicase XPB/Ssl2 N-terminal domain-containing protein n=1 Tax=Cellulomonas flavigena (strain ATCC 482 / DSM 20109 / BCRC 11376 / JCM 18109 / NBRC 3775 / NCIMB 8073 / NRS 134) TaxID=446466 RepID=D5UJB4_CELFN|nr:helicase-associated domain-containing protein [Cellulomonas flavigena]ADG73637.1 conserved hypothetical protein [Cellulomonas flavigena DSM 20109]